MDKNIIGKIFYFWLFILGGLIIGKMMRITDDVKTTIILLVLLSAVYLVWTIMRERGRKKRGD